MEFDTNISLRDCGSVEIVSSKEYDALLSNVWDVLASISKNVGEGTGGEFWVDFSGTLKTKYIVCNVSPVEENESVSRASLPGGSVSPSISPDNAPAPLHDAQFPKKYVISLRCGKKSGRLGDAFMMVFALGVFWFFSKVVVPNALLSNYVALGTCLALLVATFIHIQLPFGSKESAALLARLKEL